MAIVVLAIVIDSALYYNKVHAGVSVSGVGLGGKTKSGAMAALDAYVKTAQSDPITLSSGDNTWRVNPVDVGLTVNAQQAVADAMAASRNGNFFTDLGHRLKLYFSKKNLPLQATFDSAKLDDFIAQVAQKLDVSPVDAKLVIDGGQIKTVDGQSGNVVDRAALRTQLEPLLVGMRSAQISVPMVVKQPAVTAQNFQEAVDQSKTMTSAPVTLTGRSQSWTLTTQDIVSYMDFSSDMQNGVSTLVPYISADKMKAFFASIADQVATKPKDASFAVASDGKSAQVVPEVPGEALDPEATAKAITDAALQTTGRTAQVAATTAEPKFTTADANAYGIQDLLASYTTPSFVGSANRQVNVRITTQYASNKFLAPGEEYNFDKVIGPRTVARGYKTAPGIVANGELDEVLGGGICQVSTTLFNAVFEAGLKVTERNNHSLFINHYPPGRDATVAGNGGKNFRFVNDTAHYIWILGTSDGITTTFKIYGTNDGRTVEAHFSGFHYGATRTEVTVLNPGLQPGTTHVKIDGQSGRSCSEKRIVTYADHTTSTDIFNSNYPMIPKTIEVGPTTTTTIRTTTTTQPGTGTTVVTSF